MKDENEKNNTLSLLSSSYKRCIPQDLIDDILIRLPIKSQIRFKSTCKYWRNLISSPTFAKSYVNHLSVTPNPPLPSLLLFRSDGKIFTVHLQPNYESDFAKEKFTRCVRPNLSNSQEEGELRPLASCHGIICMIYTLRSKSQIYLWNPVLNDCRWIGCPSGIVSNDSIQRCGFGYVSSIDSYKIVLFSSKIHVYCTRYKNWRSLNYEDIINTDVGFPLINSDLSESVCWLEWDAILRDVLSYRIRKFDLKNEVYDEVKIPKLDPKGYDRLRWSLQTDMGVTRDNNLCICVFCTPNRPSYSSRPYEDEKPSCGQMWELRKGKWKKTLRIRGWDYLGNDHKLIGLACKGNVLLFEKKDIGCWEKEFMLIVDARQDQDHPSYVEVHNEYHKLDFPQPETHFKCVMSYVPSLLSPFSI